MKRKFNRFDIITSLARIKILLFLLFSSMGYYHCQTELERTYIDLKLGIGACFNKGSTYLSNMGYRATNRVTYVGGITGVYKLKEWVWVGGELMFTMRGTNFQKQNDSLVRYNFGSSGASQSSELVYYYRQNIINSLDIPFYIKFGPIDDGIAPFLNLGLSSSFTLAYKYKYNVWRGSKETWYETKVSGKSGQYSPGLIVGLGLKINNFIFELRYSGYIGTELVYFGPIEKVYTNSVVFSLSVNAFQK